MKNLIAVIIFIAIVVGGAYAYVRYQMEQEAESRRVQEEISRREKEASAKASSAGKAASDAPPLKTTSSAKPIGTAVNQPSGPLRNYRPVGKVTDAFNNHNSQLEKAASK